MGNSGVPHGASPLGHVETSDSSTWLLRSPLYRTIHIILDMCHLLGGATWHHLGCHMALTSGPKWPPKMPNQRATWQPVVLPHIMLTSLCTEAHSITIVWIHCQHIHHTSELLDSTWVLLHVIQIMYYGR